MLSRDGALVVRHETELSLHHRRRRPAGVRRPPHARARSTRVARTGWFTEDFTLAELRTLRAVERMPDLRPLNTAYDGREGMLTLAEVVELARRRSTRRAAGAGARRAEEAHLVARPRDLPMAELVVDELRRLDADRRRRPGAAAVVRRARAARAARTGSGTTARGWCSWSTTVPSDDAAGHPRRAARDLDLRRRASARPATASCCATRRTRMTGVSDLVGAAHARGWPSSRGRCAAENTFLPRHLRRGTDPAAPATPTARPGCCSPWAATASSPTAPTSPSACARRPAVPAASAGARCRSGGPRRAVRAVSRDQRSAVSRAGRGGRRSRRGRGRRR